MSKKGYVLGERSLSRLVGVDPKLVAVVKRAIEITEVDFTVLEGVRTLSRQRQLVASGASQTLKSKHITGDAVDLGAWINGAISWEERYYYAIADSMRIAALELGVGIRWGGCWLGDIRNYNSAKAALDLYVSTRRKQKRKVFLDLVHFELL